MRRRRRLLAAARQDGFALMAVLAVIGLTSLVIVALLGLLLTTIRVTEQLERDARELRAADGAITATINHLRLNQTDAGDACLPAVPSEGFRVPFAEIEDPDDVKVTCTGAADEFGASGGQVELVGDRYKGAITDWSTAWPWASLLGGSPLEGADPSLIHLGSQDLRFNGNVNAANGAAALRHPLDRTPAVTVRGSYAQGPTGIGGTGCGLLDDVGGPTQIFAAGGLSCGTPLPAPAAQDYAIDQTERTVSGGCPASPVVTFEAGRYDQDDVAVLNGWFDGSCPDRTFYFPTGIYWFDGNDGAAPEADRHALVFDDDSSSFVFGEANNWDPASGAPASAFPNACKAGVSATTPGASIVLSGRTEFRHQAGRLAVCPFVSPDGKAYPTILQQHTVPNEITVSEPPSALELKCNIESGSTCIAEASFTVTTKGEGSGSSPSKRLILTGNEKFNVTVIQMRSVRFDITPDPAVADPCTTDTFEGLPNSGRSMSYELVSGSCRAPAAPDDRPDPSDRPGHTDNGVAASDALDGASIKGVVTYEFPCPFGRCDLTEELTISGVRVDAGVHYFQGTSATSPTGDWSNPPSVLEYDNEAAEIDGVCTTRQQTGAAGRWCDYGAPRRSRSLTIEKFSSASPALPMEARISSLGVAIDYVRNGLVTARLGSTQLEATFKSARGETCSGTFTGLPNSTGPVVLDLPTCVGLVGADLVGGSLVLRTNPQCLVVGGSCIDWAQARIDRIQLVATSDSYMGPVTQAAVHVDATAGSSANFFGPAYLPNSALDIRWQGAASGASIFGGQLQLFSLGSEMADLPGVSTDVVCCTAPEVVARKVRLTASIDGRPRLEVAVSLPTDPAGSPEILDWTQCGRNGDCARLTP